ncbi:molybdopterin molybdotransferase MoeA [Cryptosporangium phraense]|uniref:Molybdopterin molybdenumtransferase n=1 Tax=Cryptosporangium phraense TaxID=2593070 RepID=A0A545AF83_9ACTN|nr:molybdopterin molybdotransferase MoeA [Cryptosporangium phraense]TQS39992.1 molybdopterin molybdotransferase MoeA [Cryptosporangium phraense]
MTHPISWDDARAAVHGAARPTSSRPVPLAEADGAVLATPLVTLTALPAFDTSSVDGYAIAGPAPWRLVGQVLAGDASEITVTPGTAVEIATGAMVPVGTEHVIRSENSEVENGAWVTAALPDKQEWRQTGEEAAAGEVLLPPGVRVTPGVLALAAACGHDVLSVRRRPRVAVVVFGDELLDSGPPGAGRVRDALGPSLPGWIRRLGAEVVGVTRAADTLEAHETAVREAAATADVVFTTGGTMHGPVDHLHPTLSALGGEYVVDTVAVRPGFPMLTATLPGPGAGWLVGLPGNPQSAVIGVVTLAAPLLAGLSGSPLPPLSSVVLANDVPGRGKDTHLALARLTPDGAVTLPHAGSAMLRGVAGADGFVIVRPGDNALAGTKADFVPMPT